MNTPRVVTMVLLVLFAGCQPQEQDPSSADTTAATDSGDWVRLFDGETLDGWHQENGTAAYSVEEGAIVGRTSTGSPNSFLVTDETYDDFEMEFEVQVHDRLNSGVQIRSSTREEAGGNFQVGRVWGPQVEIEASGADGAEAGYIYGEGGAGGWLTPEDRLIPHTTFRDGEWNAYRIIAEGPRIQTFINGEPIEDLTHEEIYETHPEGFIGLQVHGIPEDQGPYEVRWRNIRLREL